MKRNPFFLLLLLLLSLAVAAPAWAHGGDDDDRCDSAGSGSDDCDDDRDDDDRDDDGRDDDDDDRGDDRRRGGGNGGGGNAARSRNGVLKFDERSFEVSEGSGTARIRVERSKGERGSVSVTFAVFAATATAGDDFELVTGTLSWAPGDGLTKVFEIPLVDDAVSERNETVRLELSNPTGGAILDRRRGKSLLRILDNDGKAGCAGDDLCLAQGRFAVTLESRRGLARAVAASDAAGTFERAVGAPEVLVRIDDGCAQTGFYLVSLGEATGDEYLVTVVDTWTGLAKGYGRTPGAAAAGRDVATFACAGR
jgi:hypothetical protein